MKYILEIRDLTNEERQLKEVRRDYNITSNNLKSNIDIVAKSHVVAMGGYLRHMYDQVMKVTTNLSIENVRYHNIMLYFNKPKTERDIGLLITSGCCMYKFKYSEEHGIIESVTSSPLSDPYFEKYLLLLVKGWDDLKEAINSEIEKCLENQGKSMEKNIEKLEYKKKLLDNFEV